MLYLKVDQVVPGIPHLKVVLEAPALNSNKNQRYGRLLRKPVNKGCETVRWRSDLTVATIGASMGACHGYSKPVCGKDHSRYITLTRG